MQVIVIAGGRGSRYKSHEPKLLQVIAGKVLLDHYLDEIYKINDGMSNIEILFLLGKKGNEIIEYLKKIESKYSGAFQFRIEHQQLGTGGAMIQNMDLIQKECIVLLGDLYFDFNFKTFVEFAKARKARIVGVVHPNNHMHDSDKIELEPSTNQIMRIVPKSSFVKQLHANLTFAGIFYFNDFNQLKFNATGEAIDLVEVINLNLETLSCEIYGYVTLEYIKDSGTLERKREIERHIEAGTPVRRSSNKEKSVIFLDRDDTLIKDLDSDYQICE
jgi:NDP-sugar pyrophosphorylase family protein